MKVVAGDALRTANKPLQVEKQPIESKLNK
jgi:hypothetical protein